MYNKKKINHTKKDHKCQGCELLIPKGDSCFYVSSIFEGDFTYGHMCNICNAFLDSYKEIGYNDGEGWEFGTLPENWQYGPFKKGYEYGKRETETNRHLLSAGISS